MLYRTSRVVDNKVTSDLSKIAQQLFDLPLKPNSDISWGRVMALLVFGSMIAVRAVECDALKTVDTIISWITNFYDTELSSWLISKGGWVSVLVYKCGSTFAFDYTLPSPVYTTHCARRGHN